MFFLLKMRPALSSTKLLVSATTLLFARCLITWTPAVLTLVLKAPLNGSKVCLALLKLKPDDVIAPANDDGCPIHALVFWK